MQGSNTEKIIRIGLVVRPGIEECTKLAIKFLDWCTKNGYLALVEKRSLKYLFNGSEVGAGIEAVSAEELAHRANPIVSLGGDGTLIGVARYVGPENPALIGVNFGRLGFLTEILPKDLFKVLKAYFEEKVSYGLRYILACTVYRNNRPVFFSQAVNEVVIQKGVRSPLMPLDLAVNDDKVMRVKADGLILSTPTGSTAYSLAAGGPIAYPTLPIILATPMCAHSLTYRPLVLPLDSKLDVNVPDYEGKVILSIDGQVSYDLQSDDKVVVKKGDHLVKFVRSSTMDYFDILRNKLNWGVANNTSK